SAGGLDAETARQLAYQTMLGAAEMLRQTGEPPETLRRNVTSPGGTTEAAIRLMEEAGVGDAIRRAVLRAAERAAEMGADIDAEIERETAAAENGSARFPPPAAAGRSPPAARHGEAPSET